LNKIVALLSFIIGFMFVNSSMNAQSGNIYTMAGNGHAGFSGDGGLATNAQLNQPTDVFKDRLGNIYIGDRGNNRIRKVNTSGIISTIAGNGMAGYTGDGGPALLASLNAPKKAVVDGLGNIYIADEYNNVIRKIDTLGIITTIAGTGIAGFSGDGGPAINAQLDTPTGVAKDIFGNIYISDSGSNRIRKVDASGIISTYAGGGSVGFTIDGVPATSVSLCTMRNVSVDDTGGVYFTNQNCWHFLRITTSGLLYNVAGHDSATYGGDGGPADSANIEGPLGMCPDNRGNIYLSPSGNNRVRRVNTFHYISTVAGTGARGYTGDGGPAMQATFGTIYGIYADSADNVYVADIGNYVIRSFTATSYADTICVGTVVELKRNIYNGTWSSGNAVVATIDTSGRVTGIYPGTSIITYNNIAPELFLVTVKPSPIIQAFITPVSCYGFDNGSIAVNVTGGSGFYQFAWTDSSSLPYIDNLYPGAYKLLVSDSLTQCTAPDSFTITQPDSLQVIADVKNDACKSGIGSISLTVRGGTSPYRYLWSNGIAEANLEGLSPGTYTVVVTDNNTCQTKYAAQIEEDTCKVIVVHDVITPNGDGINDVWFIEGIENFPKSTVQVFDKWGDRIYEQVGYNNNWGGRGNNGEILPDGTYFYVVRLNSTNAPNGMDVFKGSILIKR